MTLLSPEGRSRTPEQALQQLCLVHRPTARILDADDARAILTHLGACGFNVTRTRAPLATMVETLVKSGVSDIADLRAKVGDVPRKRFYNVLGYLTRHGRIIRDGHATYRPGP